MNFFAPLVARVDGWLVRTTAWRRRATRFGLLLRVTVWLSGFAAIVLAFPAQPRWTFGLLLAIVMPLIAMARPDLHWVATVEFIALAGWLIGTFSEESPSLLVAGVIGAAMFVHHSAASVSSQWRVDAAVAAPVRREWLVRTGGICGGSLVVTGVIAGLAGQPLPVNPALLVVLAAAGALLIVSGVLYLLYRR